MALPSDITATRFNQREFQIQRKNHFRVEFNSNFVNEGLSFLVTSFALPRETTDTFKANYWNDAVNLPGKTNFETSSIVDISLSKVFLSESGCSIISSYILYFISLNSLKLNIIINIL